MKNKVYTVGNIETFREYCLSKKAVTESFPFDETTLVFKVLGKMFALTDTEDEFKIALKCNPEEAVILREKYKNIVPAYHFNKKHWNNIIVDENFSNDFLKQQIDNSYNLIVSKMTKKAQKELEDM